MKTIPFEKNGLAKVKNDRGRLILERKKNLSYPVRSYSDREVDEFIKLDREDQKV